MSDAKIVAYIPFRKKSIRVTNKNFRNCGDRPLYEWILKTMEKLLESKYIDDVYVDIDFDKKEIEHILILTNLFFSTEGMNYAKKQP